MPSPFNSGELEEQQWVAYLDLAGGRNTKKDPHALERNELAVSDNTWSQQGNTLQKRPGTISIPSIAPGSFGAVSAGNVGSGVGAKGLVEGRFFGQTALVEQGANLQLYAAPFALPAVSVGTNAWVSIGAISGGIIAAAQLYDPDPTNPNGPDGTLFVVNGVDTPKLWGGPGTVLRPAVVAQLPQKTGVLGPITPKYVASLHSNLFYAGEPTDPSAVYIANPFLPQQFTTNIVTPSVPITNTSYIPLYVGRGDGVNGGAITGMAPMGSAMMVYKESAIYAITQMGLQGDMVWATSIASSSVGCVSPRSIVAFDTFHVFLGIDGVYTFDGYQTAKISKNNPDLFDGATAAILDRTTAIGVRQGSRYIIFFDNGGATNAPLGYANTGAWFDFDKPDADGLPAVGTISGMNVGGIAPLRGAKDLGNWAWASALTDQIGTFNGTTGGLTVYSDFGQPITVTLLGKADFYADVWGPESTIDEKVVDQVRLLMSFPIVGGTQTYVFNGLLITDQVNTLTSAAPALALAGPGGIVGSAVVGVAQVGVATKTPAFQTIRLNQPDVPTFGAQGVIIQFGFTEASGNPWTILGYMTLVNRRQVSQ